MLRKRLNAIPLARETFAKSHDEADYRSMATVIAKTEECSIVRICFGKQKPPSRAFYSVDESGTVRQLSFDEVRQYGELPWA